MESNDFRDKVIGIDGVADKFANKCSLFAIISPFYGVVGFILGKITHEIVRCSIGDNKNKILIDKIMKYCEFIQIVLFTILSVLFTKAISGITNFTILEIVRLHLTAFSVFCIIVGNFMPKIYKNETIGIITTYSKSSNQVWTKVHRTGGKVFVISGTICLLVDIYYQVPDDVAILLNIVIYFFMFSYAVEHSKRNCE